MKLSEYKEALEGTEILSTHFEGCVAVQGNEIIRAGEVVGKLTLKTAKILFDEMFYNEFGCDYNQHTFKQLCQWPN